MDKKRPGKPLLLATLGLATLSYATVQGCGDDEPTGSGNLLPPPADGGLDGSRIVLDSGNLLPPPPQDAAPRDADISDADLPPVSGNLLPPPDASAK